MNPDDLRDAFHQAWMRQYLNRASSPVWVKEQQKAAAQEILLAELEHMWSLPERDEP